MARHFGWIVAAALLCVPVTEVTAATCEPAQPGAEKHLQQRRDDRRPRFVKWWLEPQDRAEIGISDQQSARIEEIFQSTLSAQRERYREIEKLEPIVAQMIKDGVADPTTVEKQVERLEYLGAEVRKTRILTLYRMHRELSTDQRARLKVISERREAERRKSSESKTSAPPRR
jgi:hypothetical protein